MKEGVKINSIRRGVFWGVTKKLDAKIQKPEFPKSAETIGNSKKSSVFLYDKRYNRPVLGQKNTHTGGLDELEKYLFLFSTFFKYLYFASRDPARV